MDIEQAKKLVAAERARVEAGLARATADVAAYADLEAQQSGETDDGSDLTSETTDLALENDLRDRLAAVGRAEERIAAGSYGRSIDSGEAIPDERLEIEPLAERTVDEQRRYEADQA